MTEKEKKLIAYRLKSVSRKDLVDILKLANFKVNEIERLNIDNKVVESIRNNAGNNILIAQILSIALDISVKQAEEILKSPINISDLPIEELVRQICTRDGWKNRLSCIKELKSHVDIGLKEAKDLVDECFDNYDKLFGQPISLNRKIYLDNLLDGQDLDRKLQSLTSKLARRANNEIINSQIQSKEIELEK